MPYQDQYHANANIEWRQGLAKDSAGYAKFAGKKIIGLEIEHEVGHGIGRNALIQRLDEINAPLADKFLMERDGSLDGQRGVEIILPPLPYRQLLGSKSLAKKILDTAKDVGADETNPGVGMHVNINVAGMSDLEIGSSVGAFHHMRPVVIEVAGRESNWAPFFNKLDSLDYFKYQSKSACAWYRGSRPVIEVRACRSAVDWQLAKDRIRFCSAVVDFAQRHAGVVNELILEYNGIDSANEETVNKRKYDAYISLCTDRGIPRERAMTFEQWVGYGYNKLDARVPQLGAKGNPKLIKAFGDWCAKQKSKSLKSALTRVNGGLDAIRAAA